MKPKLSVWLHKGLLATFIPAFIMFITYWIAGIYMFSIPLELFRLWFYLLFSLFLTVTTYMFLGTVLMRVDKSCIGVLLLALLHVFYYSLNIALIINSSNTMDYYVVSIPWSGFHRFIRGWTLLLTLGMAGAVGLTWWKVKNFVKASHERPRIWPVLILALIPWGMLLGREIMIKNYSTSPTRIVARTLTSNDSNINTLGPLNKFFSLARIFRIRELGRHMFQTIFEIASHREVRCNIRNAAEMNGYREVLQAWGLPLGKRSYPPLNLQPFTRILVVGGESLSLDLMAPFNAHAPKEGAPFYAPLAAQNQVLTNYMTVAMPSQPGIYAMYSSHPNSMALIQHPAHQSLLHVLKEQGFGTYWFTCVYEDFMHNDVVYGNLGIEKMYGLGHWRKDPRNEPYICGWGLLDHTLFERAVEFLDQKRNEKVLVHLATMDTHSPDMRIDYGPLKYTPTPASIEDEANDGVAEMQLSVFRHNLDLAWLLDALRAKNLLDEHTLVVVTADHCYPPNTTIRQFPGYPEDTFVRIPLALFSGQKLPPLPATGQFSQLDFAPTILHLLNLPIPEPWWGTSIYSGANQTPWIYRLRDELIVRTPKQTNTLNLFAPSGQQQPITDLYRTIFR